jgi:hypothetical protein
MTIANRLAFPFSAFMLSTGVPASGYKLKFYVSGASTTPANIYRTYDGSTLGSAATSVTLNASGVLDVDIYLDPTVNYRMVITDASDTPVFTYDNVRDLGRQAAARFQLYAGNPNGNVAGTAGTVGGSPSDVIFDTTNGIVWVCTTTGTAGTAVWTNTSGALSGSVAMTGVLSPASFSTQQNDYNPTDLATASTIRLNPGASVDLTGLAGGTSGRQMMLFNTSANFTVTLRNQDADSTAANRFLLANGKDVALLANYGAGLQYDSTTGRWRLKIPPFADLKLPRGYIDGFILSNGADTTNDINFAAGECRDSTNTFNITGAAMAGKQLDVGWAPGAGTGMRNSAAAITNTTYHLYSVAKADGTQDYYAHTSTTVATVLTALGVESGGTDYLYARRVGSIVRAGGTILAFLQEGNDFWWDVPVSDLTNSTIAQAGTTLTLTVPAGIKVLARFNASVGTLARNLLFYSPTQTGAAPSLTSVPVGHVGNTGSEAQGTVICLTNTSAQVVGRAGGGADDTDASISTLGYTDARGRDA